MFDETDYLQAYSSCYMQNFGAPKLVIQRGSGSVVLDIQGKEYIDLLGGIAVNALGHAHPEIAQTITNQAKRLMHISNFFTTPEQVKLAAKLASLTGSSGDATAQSANPQNAGGNTGDARVDNLQTRVLLTNSGTEAVEGALKIVKEHAGKNLGAPNARIIALEGSFHGRTLGALSLTSKQKYREPFAPLIPNIQFVKPNDISALEEVFRDAKSNPIAGVFIEIIQGEAGVLPLDNAYVQRVRELTKKHNALLVVDEVQTGIARTGSWFAYLAHNITPDVITLAKGLGGGFPIGAVITKGAASGILQPGDHGTTFGGNPLAAATALKVLEIIERDGLVGAMGERFKFVQEIVASLNNLNIREVRGAGLLIAIELAKPLASAVYERALELGLICNACNETTIRLAPALNIDLITLHKGLRLLDRAIREVFEEAHKNVDEEKGNEKLAQRQP